MQPTIAGPVADPKAPDLATPEGACDCHAHIFGPPDRFPYTEGRGYTPPDAPLEAYLALLDRLGCARGVVVQGNAHGYDNRAILDALERAPSRLRGVAITDDSVTAGELRRWHDLGVRGLRFHFFAPGNEPGYKRGVGLKVLEALRPVMEDLGWHVQAWCDWHAMEALAPVIRDIATTMPVVIDHMLNIDARDGVGLPAFQQVLALLSDGACWVKVSGAYRISQQYPGYPDAQPFHEALVAANPEQIVWGTDWPHPQVDAAVMPDDGVLLDLFNAWTPDAATRQRILVDNPQRLYGF